MSFRDDKIKPNLFQINNGYYLSKQDPRFWSKLLNIQPNNYEAMYHVGLELEDEGNKYFDEHKKTGSPYYLEQYKSKLKKALGLETKAFDEGCYYLALTAKRRINGKLESYKPLLDNPSEPSRSIFGIPHLILLGVIAVGIVILILLNLPIVKNNFNSKTTVINNTYAKMIPYQIIHEKPKERFDDIYTTSSQLVSPGEDEQVLVNKMLNTLTLLYEKNPIGPIKVVFIEQGTNKEVGMAVWEGEDYSANIYIYEESLQVTYDVWETTTVIRSALYQFAYKNGFMPEGLSDLGKPIPANYLTSIPKEPNSMKNTVSPVFDNSGGWVYRPLPLSTKDNLIEAVGESLFPNTLSNRNIPFEPIEIYIDKSSHILVTASGKKMIKSYPVALGRSDSSPEGSFFINKKVMNPDKNVPLKNNTYGSRGMELSDPLYAIHGTNDSSSIGKDVSMGCIRLNNPDIEDLYSYVPLYTRVNIGIDNTKQLNNPLSYNNGANNTRKNFYNNTDNPIEEDQYTSYSWRY